MRGALVPENVSGHITGYGNENNWRTRRDSNARPLPSELANVAPNKGSVTLLGRLWLTLRTVRVLIYCL